MFPSAILTPWTRLFASLALEAILVFALAALLARLVRSAAGQRAVWRMSFVAAAALMLAEVSGLGHAARQLLRAAAPAATPSRAALVTTTVITDAPPAIAAPPPDTGILPAPPSSPERPSPFLVRCLPALALAGLIWLGARRGIGALWLIRLRRDAQPDNGALSARVRTLARRLGIRRRVRVKIISPLTGPIAFGVFRPVIAVPADFATGHTAAQQDAMLAHELAHVAAFDALWILAADFVTALIWWHPLAWWARRRLRAASEAAADEASLLVDDGPALLAECLVALGGRLARTPAFGGLGMAEHRFRSELGRRVERLLALRGQDRRPWRGATAWLARTLGPVALIALALAAVAWLLPRDSRAASLSEAFHRSPLGLATTALLTADESDAPKLILQGARLHAAGKTNEAAAKWSAALELDPGNTVARDYLTRISRTNFPIAKPAVQSDPLLTPIPISRTAYINTINTSKARQNVFAMLDTIRLDSVKFDTMSLSQVVDALVREARNRDPEQKGLNIIISSTANPQVSAAPQFDPIVGSVLDAESDIAAAVIRIDPPINDISLRHVLEILVRVSDLPIKYSVEDWGVLISARRTGDLPPLHTRWYKIDPRTFTQGLRDVIDLRFDSRSPRQPRFSRSPATNDVSPELSVQLARNYFLSAGVDLQAPKAIVLNDRLGMLMVRATLQDLDLIEQAVQVLNMIPPQVQIEVKFCEVPEELLAAPGLKLRPDTSATNQTGADTHLNGLTGVLTPEQYRNIIRALEQKEGVKFLAAPRVLTPSGRQAQIKTVEVRNIVTGLDLTTNRPPEPGKPPEHPYIAESFELGPAVDVVPYVAADGRTIQMTVIPSIKEFVGYDLDSSHSKDIWDYVESPGANPSPARAHAQQYPLPIFRLRQVVTSATVWDGQTLVLATRTAKTGPPDNHPANKLAKELLDQLSAKVLSSVKTSPKAMLVFITPTIVDPAGNRVHTDEELRGRSNPVPPQIPSPGK